MYKLLQMDPKRLAIIKRNCYRHECILSYLVKTTANNRKDGEERYEASLLVPDFFVWQLMQFLLYCHILSPFLYLTTVLDVPEAGWTTKKKIKEKG